MPWESKDKEKEVLFKHFDDFGVLEDTETIKKVCTDVGISLPTFYKWRDFYKKDKSKGGVFDLKKQAQIDVPQVWDSIIKTALKGSPKSQEVALKTYANITEEQKKEELTADDYIRIAIKTRDALREELRESNGVCPLCGIVPVLHEEICVDKEREPEQDGEVAELAVSSGLVADSSQPSGNLDRQG